MRVNPSEPPMESSAGPTSGLFKSVGQLLHTTLTIAQTRLELLTTELQEEVQRAAKLLVWAFVALVCAFIGLLLAALTIVFAFWETHRVAASVGVTIFFLVLTAIAAGVMSAKLKARPRLLDASLTELARDRDELKAHLERDR